MQQAEEAGYRSGWRGVVAYWASPWLWTKRSFTALVVAAATLLCAGLFSFLAEPTATGTKMLSGALGALLAALLVVRPMTRAWQLRATRCGSADDHL